MNAYTAHMLARTTSLLENFCFRFRTPFLIWLGAFTVVMGYFGLQLRMEAGFEKQLPADHEYIATFKKYRNDVIGANRLTVVVKAASGSIWSKEGLDRLYDVTQAVMFLPNVLRANVQSLWTPNTFVNEITEDGFRADPLIGGTVTPDRLTPGLIAEIQRSANQGGFIGTLVSHDQSSAMIIAELSEIGTDGSKIDYVKFNDTLEKQIRKKFEDAGFKIEIIGFAKEIGDIADGASGVFRFCAMALVLTSLSVYWYCRSIRFTFLAIFSSFTSLVWQFGALRLLGMGLDPLAVLVPFLVFAIGVSHGVQQINAMLRTLSLGKTTMEAARSSFSGLLIPGLLALVTAFVSFITLVMIPIPMVRELAITASLGIFFKITTNLAMLPVAASYFHFSKDYACSVMATLEYRAGYLKRIARLAEPNRAVIVVLATLGLLAVAVWQSRDRVVGTLEPGAPELRPDARFNLDAVDIAGSYDMGLDWLTVIFEAPPQSCDNVALGTYQDKFLWSMQNVDGVLSAVSYSSQLKTYNQGYNEGYPKMNAVPIDPANYAALSTEIGRIRGFMSKDCNMTAVYLFLADHKATTINHVIDQVKAFRTANTLQGVAIRLASGNAGVLAAVNDEVAKSETPMLLYVYAAIVLLVFTVYRDLRAVVACCLPLTVATFIGYWFMKELRIGLTVATLPVMVLAVGIGVDYAFYIYNRLQLHLAEGAPIVEAIENSILEVGAATIFTALTLAVGVATWAFSSLKFQADMGKLLAFMFMVNMVMAMTALPALVVVLERLFPRRGPVKAPGLLCHGKTGDVR
ncbi:MMPL family transporter [Telmatospirillum sp.]|uniref:efflux RND transporter permease subunit n=1 Tax=Telmatospirillum sp. TaxID=2079197 RepID=UPI0028491ACA|nr:MMPL family transporter [Telmatospirillum sp.]MDR3438749.1 MMPL family transporter [Telmatospirillum sp.]